MIANALTILRLALLAPFLQACAAAMAGGARGGAVPLVLFSAAAASDLLDGWAARPWGTASDRGRALDHASDMVFVMTSIVFFAALGRVPWWVPAATGGAVAVYGLDLGLAFRGGGATVPGRSMLGHAGGVLNYALVGVLAADVSLPALLPARLVLLVAAIVAGINAASAVERAARRLRGRAALEITSFEQPRRA